MLNNDKATEVRSQVAQTIEQNINLTTNPTELKRSLENKVQEGKIPEGELDLLNESLNLNNWPDPSNLIGHTLPLPYPINALPTGIRAAVIEAVEFLQCPIVLPVLSALTALSLAAQGLADVCRTEILTGPISLYLLAIADSGERKTTCDHLFTSQIREWERQQIANMQPEQIKYDSAMKIFNAKIDGIITEIKRKAKSCPSIDTAALEEKLDNLVAEKPKPPRIPKIFYSDSTPEALAWNIASGWHSASIVSSEAGIIFGSHGMGKESVTRNLALLNTLWDGGDHKVDRRTTANFIIRGARLTIGLAAQFDVVRSFLDTSNGLARSIGFMARLLVACPSSTQGERFFKPPPKHCPQLTLFQNRIIYLLNQPLKVNDLGELSPTTLNFSPEAESRWIEIYNDVEIELKPTGDMATVRDVASKAADNVARLAALFHIYEHGPTGNISVDSVERAACIVTWHLYEAKRFLGEMALPSDLLDALMLDNWLLEYARKNHTRMIHRRELQQLGPNSLRAKEKLNAAINILVEAERIRVLKDGRQKLIYINPKLLGIAHGTPTECEY